MSDRYRADGLDERAAERLLDGAGGPAPLHALLAAAAAPARPEELAGEDAAVAAFRAAPLPERGSRAALLRRFLTIKVVAIVGGSLILTGGAAYATITGQFPGQNPAPSPSPTLNRHEGTGGDSTPATRLPPPGTTSGGSPPSSSSPSPSPSPDASKKHGKAGAPGQQKKATPPGRRKKTKAPRHTAKPPRGPGNNNDPAASGITGSATTSAGGSGGGGSEGGGSGGGGAQTPSYGTGSEAQP